MAAPIKSAAHIPATSPMNSPPRTADWLLSDSVSHRSFEVIQMPQGAAGVWTGSFVDNTGAPAATPAAIHGILLYSTNPTDGPVNATVLVRDAEVIDAYLQYGAMDPVAVNTQLATLGIIVRAAVLPNVQGATFAPDVPPSGPPVSGIQSTDAPPPPDGEGAVQTGRA
jgi:hypothetical protein